MGKDYEPSHWLGRQESAEDDLTASLLERFRAVIPFDTTQRENSAPPGIHWCIAPIIEPANRLGPDGHPALGTHLPPLPFARRMWAGGSLEYGSNPFRAGQKILRSSTIRSIEEKQGRSGKLGFVTVEHHYSCEKKILLRETQTLVYRDPAPETDNPQSVTPSSLARKAQPVFSFKPDPVLLFRYSALTFNGHRIHYDEPYATGVEGHAGLVVHGPLIATILANIAHKELGRLSAFTFRSHSPAIVDQRLACFMENNGDGLALEAATGEGRLVMTASAR